MKTLLDLLHSAHVIAVDGVLCENFYLESEMDGDEDTALDVSYEEDGNLYQHFISFEEMAKAEQRPDGSWVVNSNNGDWGGNATTLVPYELNELKLDK